MLHDNEHVCCLLMAEMIDTFFVHKYIEILFHVLLNAMTFFHLYKVVIIAHVENICI